MTDGVPTMRAELGGAPFGDHIYNRLLKERIVLLGTQVDDALANAICAQLLLLSADDPNKDIFLYSNSPGGSVSAGLAIYDTMQFINDDVATVVMGSQEAWGSSCCAPARRASGTRSRTPA